MANRTDQWIQRVLVGALLVLALGLVACGVVLYAPHPGSPPPAVNGTLAR